MLIYYIKSRFHYVYTIYPLCYVYTMNTQHTMSNYTYMFKGYNIYHVTTIYFFLSSFFPFPYPSYPSSYLSLPRSASFMPSTA